MVERSAEPEPAELLFSAADFFASGILKGLRASLRARSTHGPVRSKAKTAVCINQPDLTQTVLGLNPDLSKPSGHLWPPDWQTLDRSLHAGRFILVVEVRNQ